MIYVVTGYMRTGTSMMMQCLETGGLETVFSSGREVMNEMHGDERYQPNAGGFYELDFNQLCGPHFIRDTEGKLVKVLRQAALRLPEHNYRVVVMWRHPEESRQSFEAFFNRRWPLGDIPEEEFRASWERFVEALRGREDMEVSTLEYRDVVEHPVESFASLGWPIDVEKAAAIVDPAQYRFRLERLTVGI